MIITDDWLIKNKTPAGGYNKKQFNILGIQYPPQKRWKQQIIGKNLCDDKVKEFENISGFINNTNKVNRLINICDLYNFNID